MVHTIMTIKAKRDLLSRAATELNFQLAEIKSDVYFRAFERQINAKSLLGLLSLGIRQGETFEAHIISLDDTAAAIDCSKFIKAIEHCGIIVLFE